MGHKEVCIMVDEGSTLNFAPDRIAKYLDAPIKPPHRHYRHLLVTGTIFLAPLYVAKFLSVCKNISFSLILPFAYL